MSRLIESIQMEFELLGAVLTYHIRSYVLFCTAFALPAAMLMVTTNLLEASTISGLADGIRPMLGLVALVMMAKLLFLAAQTYLKDRKAVLAF